MADPTLTARDAMDLPLSDTQRAIWLDLQLNPGKAPFYNLTDYTELTGTIDPMTIERALCFVVSKSAALRARFGVRGQEPYQTIHPDTPVRVSHVDVSDATDPPSKAITWMERERQSCFDPCGTELLRFAVLRLSPTKTYLCSHFHHLIIDGYGMGLFRARVAAVYTAFMENRVPELDDDLAAYVAYIKSDTDYRRSPQFSVDREYWAGRTPSTLSTLSVHRREPPPGQRIVESVDQPFSPELRTDLMQAAARLGIGLPQLLISAVVLFLYCTTRNREITIGLPTHGRVESWMRELIAACSNMLPITFRVDKEKTITESLRDMHAQLREALAHKRHRHDDIRRAQGVKAGAGDNFHIVVNAIPFPTALSFAGCPVIPHSLTVPHVEDMTVCLFTSPAGTGSIKFDASPAKYEPWEIDRHFEHLQSFLHVVTHDASRRLSQISLIDLSEIDILSGKTADVVSVGSSIHQLIGDQARQTPQAIAAIANDQSLSFIELENRASRLACDLRTRGVKRGDFVAILLDRSLDLLVAVLGILKSGAAYLPLDSENPPERLRHILREADPLVVITTRAHLHRHADVGGRDILILGESPTAPLSEPLTGINSESDPNDAAYCIYTSGTTGLPKGVVVEHRNVLNHITAMASACRLTSDDRVLQFFSASFDAWVEEVFPTWITGATLVVQPEKVLPLQTFSDFIDHHKISVLNLPVAYWRLWVADLARARRPLPSSIRLVIIGGEKVLRETYRQWTGLDGAERITLINTYGPTEATVTSTLYALHATDSDGDIPIGRPIQNTRAYILNETMTPVPVGAIGELCLAGAGVARGYLKDDTLTTERFVDWHYENIHERIYRTGDMARYRPDGNIEFIGRMDHQVKINGYRVELGEIETVMARHPSVDQCVAVMTRDHSPRLVAYVVLRHDSALDAEELRRFATAHLPSYMVPVDFLRSATLPLTRSGKIDRSALSLSVPAAIRAAPYTAPRSEMERRIAAIWAEALKVERVGVNQDLVELGGDSLTAIYILSRLQEINPAALTLQALFEARTVEKLAKAIQKSSGGNLDKHHGQG